MDNVFVGRQPIYNKNLNAYAFELLFCPEKDNNYLSAMLAMSSLDERPSEMLRTTMVQAKTCEIIAEKFMCIT